MIKHIVYNNPEVFWQEISGYLLLDSIKNSLCLGICKQLIAKPEDCVYQAAVFDGEQFLGSLICSQFFTNCNLLPSAHPNKATAEILVSNFLEKNIKVTGFIADTDTADHYIELFNKAAIRTSLSMLQGLYNCSKVIMPKVNKQLIFRVAEEKDIAVLSTWLIDFQNEAVPFDPPLDGRVLALNRINNGSLFVLEKGTELVAMAGYSRDLGISCCVNLVYTPKDKRKNGYGSYLAAELTNKLLARGKENISLYTDMANPTSNKIYKTIGYKFICKSVHLGLQYLT